MAKTYTTSDPLPFFGPVNSRDQNPAAHGGVRYRIDRSDGWYRFILVNGLHTEEGNWIPPE